MLGDESVQVLLLIIMLPLGLSLLTNPIPLCHCQYLVLSLKNALPANFNRTN